MPALPLLWLALAAPPGSALDLAEREPALLIVALPKGAAPKLPATDITRAAARAFAAHTGLDLRPPEQAGVDSERLARCDGPGRLACWLSAVDETPLTAILVVTALPVGRGTDRLTLTLIDTRRALTCERERSLPAREATEALEDCIWTSSARAAPAEVDAAGLEAFFEDQLLQPLAPALEAMGQLEPFGRIELDCALSGVTLSVDGVARGVLPAGVTTVREVRPGRRILELARPSFASARIPVHIARKQTATVAVALLPLEAPPTEAGRHALLYAGGPAAVAGVALGVYALARAGSVDSACLTTDPEASCEALGAPTFSLSTDDLPSTDREVVNPAGVPIPAVAAGVGLTGLGWLAGALLFDEEGVPWWGILTGLAAGALGAVVTVAADPR